MNDRNAAPLIGKRALVVEDTPLIAMDCEESLLELGFSEVVVCASLSDGLSAAADGAFDFAVLDVDLAGHSSAEIAVELARRAIPFVVATGNAESVRFVSAFAGRPTVIKPYSIGELRDCVAALLSRSIGS
jgi:DNA-binding response OmpR family regulator